MTIEPLNDSEAEAWRAAAEELDRAGRPEAAHIARSMAEEQFDSRHPAHWYCLDCGYRAVDRGRPSVNICPRCRGDFTWTPEPHDAD